MQTHHPDTVGLRSEKWGGVFPRLVWRIQNITTSSDWRPHKSSKAYRTKGIAWCWGAADAKGFNFSNDKSLYSKSRVVGCRLSAQVRSGDGGIINTVRVKPMTCLSCYSQLSDLSRKDIKRKCGWKAKHCGWEQGGGGPCEEWTLLSPGFCIALSFLIRKLMQLSVLILESSFYAFSSSSLQPFSIPFSTNLCSGSRW